MDLQILDEMFIRKEILSEYQSLVWTDRLTKCGDFELKVSANNPLLSLLKTNYFLEAPMSDRTMAIETLLKDADSNTVTVTGRSIEAKFEDRADTREFTFAIGIDTVAQIMNDVVHSMIFDGYPVIPGVVIGAMAAGTPAVSWNADLNSTGTLYSKLSTLSEQYAVGWKLVRTPVSGSQVMTYSSYVGTDRTKANPAVDWVLFDSSLDNLAGVSYLQSSANFKTHAWVVQEDTSTGIGIPYIEVIAPWYVAGADPFQKKILTMPPTPGPDKADYTDAEWLAVKQRMGLLALARNNMVDIIDGTVLSTGDAVYGQHYFLGDLVSLGSDQLNTRTVRVTEHIWSEDGTGLKTYPTFVTV